MKDSILEKVLSQRQMLSVLHITGHLTLTLTVPDDDFVRYYVRIERWRLSMCLSMDR